jgi:dihydrolipoamide dehydrogenase
MEISMEQAHAVFDVVVLGGGPAGENVVERVVREGLTAAVVESELVGGECSYWACVPSKALLRPVDVVAAARRSPGAAEAVTGQLHVGAALARRDEATSNHDDQGQVRWPACPRSSSAATAGSPAPVQSSSSPADLSDG